MADLDPNLGPLARLAGLWEGTKGRDVAPSVPERDIAKSNFRERIELVPIGRVDNHEQVLYGLRYRTTAWRVGAAEDDPFHEEVGYWLWDAANEQVIRSFIVPRGVTVLAGGTAKADADAFHLAAEVGSDTYGICSNVWLDGQFKTVRYTLDLTIESEDAWRYEEDTVMRVRGRDELFHHTDGNALVRVG